LNFTGNVACSKDRLASLVITCANVYLQALSSEVGTKSRGDELADIDPINLATSSSDGGKYGHLRSLVMKIYNYNNIVYSYCL